MSRKLTFQVAGSAGIKPLPIMGSKMSDSIPLQYWSGVLSLSTFLAMTGSLMTRNDFGPKLRVKMGP